MWVSGKFRRSSSGQSFVELAVVLPILALLMVGLVEVAYLFFFYMTAVDQTREAARFASVRDFYVLDMADVNDLPNGPCTDEFLHFYYDTACFFTDPNLNPYLEISPTQYADVTISVFSVAGSTVSHRWPRSGFPPSATNPPVDPDGDNVWSLYSTNNIPNWKYNCDGVEVLSEPFFSNQDIQNMFVPNAPPNRGLVLIEVWYCHHQLLNFPIFSQVIRPLRMHAYSIMPLPNAIPTPTAIPGP